MRSLSLVLFSCFFALAGLPLLGALAPTYLRCEYRVDPVGIDEQAPRLSWRLERAPDDSKRGGHQVAWRIIVAASPEELAQNKGSLWDSGRQEGDACTGIVYQGKKLAAHQVCFWKVLVVTDENPEGAWSREARWVMGMGNDWQAAWIGNDEIQAQAVDEETMAVENSLPKASWIEIPADPALTPGTAGKAAFRRVFTLPAGERVHKARWRILATGKFLPVINNGQRIASGRMREDAFELEVGNQLLAGRNVLTVEVDTKGGDPVRVLSALDVRLCSGRTYSLVSDQDWVACRNPVGEWRELATPQGTWPQVGPVGANGCAPWGLVRAKSFFNFLPPAQLRRDFELAEKPARALLYVTAFGAIDPYLNGVPVSDERFTPGWTDYHRRVYYRAYDVTERLKSGANTLGAILGDGWYRGCISNGGPRFYGTRTRLKAELHIWNSAGSEQVIASDASWTTAIGATLEADMQGGELFDARRATPGWAAPGFDARGWKPVTVGGEEMKPVLSAHPADPVRPQETIAPVNTRELAPGRYLLDLGQNFAGWARLRVRGAKPGTVVTLRFAEMLNQEGTPYYANLRTARATDTYVCNGEGEETWEPRFTYHGFRYIEVSGLPSKPESGDIVGVVAHTGMPMTGSFECSNPLVNRIWLNALWGQRSNYVEVPTDCPQRDERMGWTGDAQVFARTAAYNMDVSAFLSKWMVDIADAQTPQGAVMTTAPGAQRGWLPGWADAVWVIPGVLYQNTGDRSLLERSYPAMVRHLELCRSKASALIMPEEGIGDWLSAGPATPKTLISTAYFARASQKMAEYARVLGRQADAADYQKLADGIAAAFRAKFVKADGRIESGTQTAYLLALRFGLLADESQQAKATAHLGRAIQANGYRLSTGFLGVNLLLPTLSEYGLGDLAYRLIQTKEFPSWGYSIEQGATTSWERWNSYTKESGFGPVNMNSFNHYAYGACGEWLYRSVLGIDSAEAGYRRIRIEPEPGKGIEWARGHYDSVRGRIASDWRIQDGRMLLVLSIPPNTLAELRLPGDKAESLLEGGRLAKESNGIRYLLTDKGKTHWELEPGSYRLELKLTE